MDIPRGKVYRMRPEEGRVHVAATVDAKPSGLGPRPDGTPLVVTQADSALRRITPDGGILYVAEAFGFRVSAFDVDPDGKPSNQRVFKQFDSLEQDAADGLCVDSAGAVWATTPFSSEVRRIMPDGTVTDRVATATEGHFVVSCALGGPDLRTLYLCAAETDMERMANNFEGTGRVEAVEVEVPGIDHR